MFTLEESRRTTFGNRIDRVDSNFMKKSIIAKFLPIKFSLRKRSCLLMRTYGLSRVEIIRFDHPSSMGVSLGGKRISL